MSSRYISPSLRQAVLERDHYTCQYCGCSGTEATLEIDHIVPVSKGGVSDMNNLVTACFDCNRAKHDTLLCTRELRDIADSIGASVDYLTSLIGDRPRVDTVQVSVYLPRSTYEGIRDLAANSGQGISDILARLAFCFTENNAETLARIREVRRLSLTYSLRED